MEWYRVVLRVRVRSTGLVSFVSFSDYASSSDVAVSQTVDYSVQNLLYDVLEVVSVIPLPR